MCTVIAAPPSPWPAAPIASLQGSHHTLCSVFAVHCFYKEHMFSSSLIDIPRPFIDPIHSLVKALGITSMVMQRPRTASTIVLVVDQERRGLHLNRFAPLTHGVFHDIVSDVSRLDNAHGVMLCSVRSTSPIHSSDLDLWQCGHTVFNNAGLEFVDWCVVGTGGYYCPRSLIGSPDPWPKSAACV